MKESSFFYYFFVLFACFFVLERVRGQTPSKIASWGPNFNTLVGFGVFLGSQVGGQNRRCKAFAPQIFYFSPLGGPRWAQDGPRRLQRAILGRIWEDFRLIFGDFGDILGPTLGKNAFATLAFCFACLCSSSAALRLFSSRFSVPFALHMFFCLLFSVWRFPFPR